MVNAKELVDGKIASKKVMLFTKSFCKYSKKAREVFQKHIEEIKDLLEADYEYLDLDQYPEAEMAEIQDYLGTITGARSVPRVFINGKFEGGCDTTLEKEEKGEISKLIA